MTNPTPGTKVNSLTVLNAPRGARISVRCDCGTTKDVNTKVLKSGRQQACGKGHKERMMIGQTYGRLTVIAVDSQRPGNVIADCDCGYHNVTVHGGRVRKGIRRSCGCLNLEQIGAVGAVANKGKTGKAHPSYGIKKEKHHNWKGDEVSYSGAHSRLKAWYGSARNHRCFNCGGQARDWAYNNACANERMQEGGEGDGMMYCTHVECYVTACRPCHTSILDENKSMVIKLNGHNCIAPRIAKEHA